MPLSAHQRTSSLKNESPDSQNGMKGSRHSDEGYGQGKSGGEVKQQKACVQCRRSKVKCVHEGGPPCRRCLDTKQECKFRLRADDETWRERTDETLNKLSQALDTLISRGTPSAQPHSRPIMPLRNSSTPGLHSQYTPYSPGSHQSYQSHQNHQSHPSFGPSLPFPQPTNRAFHNGLPPLASPHSEPVPDYHSPSHDLNGSNEIGSPGYERKLIPRKRESSSYDGDGNSFHHPSPQTPSQMSRHRFSSATLMPPPLPPMTINSDQTTPSPVLSHLLSIGGTIHIPGFGNGPRWMVGNTTSYAKATSFIGRDDPRLNVMGIGIIMMDRAKALFIYFAEKLQPHSFGFPTYPAAEQMTPLIISSILTVSSLYEPYSRQCHDALKKDLLGTLKLEQEVHADLPLDPELGIGVEEITGACIASAWLGGETGWKIARISRWWTIGYLKHFELPDRNLTVGECLTILPPFRQIDLVDKLRIFLAAYVAEAQQAFILDRPTLIPSADPMPYVEALRIAFNDNGPLSASPASVNGVDTRGSMTGGSGGAQKRPPPPDRQLAGHASILFILLEAQRLQREARWAVNAEEGRYGPYGQSPNDGMVSSAVVHDCVERLIGIWSRWMEETEQWKAAAANLEDLSSSTASAMDLTLTYHLTKAHLGSLALEPEYHASSQIARAASQDPRLLQMQTQIISTAKTNAMSALQLAISPVGFRDRLIYLPSFYHFLLGHSAGFLLLLLQRKGRYMLAGEAKVIFETVEQFSQIFISELANHSFHPHASISVHHSMATAEALSRACQHLRSQARGI